MMPIQVEKILVDFDPYNETANVVTRKCYRCKQVKDIDCFKRCFCTSKHSYYYDKYTMTCSECPDKLDLKPVQHSYNVTLLHTQLYIIITLQL